MSYLVAADTGGTFTDFVAYDVERRRFSYAKSLTTYDNPMRGVMDCVDKSSIDLALAESVKFGTTLVINAYLQRNGVRAALITTKGFRDLLEIRRGNRSVPFDLTFEREPALVPRDLRYQVSERLNAKGEIVVPLDIPGLDRLAADLRRDGVEAVAVSFLNAYVNDVHERAAADRLRQMLPGLYVTTGSELTREWYEYERTSTAVANAYVGPILDRFLLNMKATLADAGFAKRTYLMASNGGAFSLDQARRQPVMLVESGPVGGCIGAAAYASALGLSKVIAFDMGGTSAKCAIVDNGRFDTKSPYYVGGPEYGFPIRGSVIDIIEVGAGGGSIASVDGHGRLSVGPRSAGSTPGPVCYGRGGSEPTITDADLALGRIGETSFLGGSLQLDRPAAEAAIRRRVGTPLGYQDRDLDRVAQGILDLGVMTMSGAINQVTSERGLDPRDFALFVFGGGGPVHGATLAREIGIPRVIVPPQPGLFSAVGMLLAGAKVDETRTFLSSVSPDADARVLRLFEEMEHAAIAQLPNGVSAAGRSIERHAQLRYKGQRHSLKTNIGGARDADTVLRAFRSAYVERYGHADSNSAVEFVALGVTVTAAIHGLEPRMLTPPGGDTAPVPVGFRDVYFKDTSFKDISARVPTPIYRRSDLPLGFACAGPVVVEEYGSCTIVGPRDHLKVGTFGELNVTIGGR